MTKKIVTDPVETFAHLDLVLCHVEEALRLLLPVRLPVATECCYLASTADTLRALRAAVGKAGRLPPDPEGMNGRRAAWAGTALAAFRKATDADEEDALGDLIADLMHWSDRNEFDFEAALDRARFHYDAETTACQEADPVACSATDDGAGEPMTTDTPTDAAHPAVSPTAAARPKVQFTLAGLDGNALSLIGAWRNAARDQGWAEADIEAVSHEALSGNYGQVLRTLLANSEPPDDSDAE